MVEPFADKFMKFKDETNFELSRFANHQNTFEDMNSVFSILESSETVSETLKVNLRDALKDYIKYIESKPELVDRFGQ